MAAIRRSLLLRLLALLLPAGGRRDIARHVFGAKIERRQCCGVFVVDDPELDREVGAGPKLSAGILGYSCLAREGGGLRGSSATRQFRWRCL